MQRSFSSHEIFSCHNQLFLRMLKHINRYIYTRTLGSFFENLWWISLASTRASGHRAISYKNIYTVMLSKKKLHQFSPHSLTLRLLRPSLSDRFRVCSVRLRRRLRSLDRRVQSRSAWARTPSRTRNSGWSCGGWSLQPSAWETQPWKKNFMVDMKSLN